MRGFGLICAVALATPAAAQVGQGPLLTPLAAPLPPRDQAFPGGLELCVDATDTDHKVYRVHEVVSMAAGRPVTLLYPQWETASHAPTASVAALDQLAASAR